MDFNTLLIHASSTGKVLTPGTGECTEKQLELIQELREKKTLTDKQRDELNRLVTKRDNPELSETCKTHLIECYVEAKYERFKEIKSKYLEHGTVQEDDGITLLSRLEKQYYKKNTEQLTNRYLIGMPDLSDSEDIRKATEILDIKCPFDIFTFHKAKFSYVDFNYEMQGQSYMALTGAENFKLCYTLVNQSAAMIVKEKKKILWSMDVIDQENDPLYVEACKKIEIDRIFDLKLFMEAYPGFDFHNSLEEWRYDVPMEERLHKIEIARDDEKIKKMYAKIDRCRRWLDEKFNKKAA